MHNKQNNIDELFSDKLHDFGPLPPASVWEKLEKNIEQKRKARAWLWIVRSGIAASLLVAFGTGWYFASHKANTVLHDTQLVKTEIPHSTSNPSLDGNPVDEIHRRQSQSSTNLNPSGTSASGKEQTVLKTPDKKNESEERIVKSPQFANQLIPVQKLSSHQVLAKQTQPIEGSLCLPLHENLSLTEEDQAIIAFNLEQIKTNQGAKETLAQKWSIGAQLSPNQQFDEIPSFSGDYYEESPSITGSDVTNISSEYDVNLSGGFIVQYQATKKISLQSGVNYSTISQNNNGVPIAFAGHNWLSSRDDYAYQEGTYTSNKATPGNTNINANMGIANLVLPAGADVLVNKRAETDYSGWAQNYQFMQKSGYIEIPFIARYQLFGKSLGLHLLGGINTNILVSNQALLLNDQEILAKGRIEDLNTLSFSTSMGLGINYTLLEKFQFSLEPTLKMMLNDLNNSADIEVRPYTIGIYTGINYRF